MSFTFINGKITLAHYKEEHKLKFHKVIMEWMEVKKGKRNPKKMSHFSRLFMNAITKHGINADEFINAEVEKDESLKKLVNEI